MTVIKCVVNVDSFSQNQNEFFVVSTHICLVVVIVIVIVVVVIGVCLVVIVVSIVT